MGPAGRLAIFILFIVLGLIVATIVTAVMIIGSGAEKKDLLIWVQGISQLIMFLCPALFFAWLFESNISVFFQTGIKKWQTAPILLAMLLIIIAIPMIDFLTSWNESLHLPESLSQWEAGMRQKQATSQELMKGFLARPGIGNMLLNLIVLAAIPAVCEEFAFRGVIQKTLVGWFRNPHVAIVTTAAIFSLIHFEMFYFVPRFVLGIFLGYIFLYSRTIWASVLAHFTNNAIIVILTYAKSCGIINFDPQNIQLPNSVLFGIISIVISIFVIILIVKLSKKNQKRYSKSELS